MGVETGIQWCHATFNPWIGCAKVSPGCKGCYAEAEQDHRYGRVKWGPNGTRHITSDTYWRQPLRWNREAEQAGERRRVFCASLADVWEARAELNAPRARLFSLIDQTPELDWLLLTKRPENWASYTMAQLCSDGEYHGMVELTRRDVVRPNVWAGVSVEDQARADERIPRLLKIPAAVRFLSVEPLLGPVDLGRVRHQLRGESYETASVLRSDDGFGLSAPRNQVDWVIVGGESGPGARPCDLAWVRSIVRQCQAAGVACFAKQLGSRPFDSFYRSGVADQAVHLRDKKGGDPSEWPKDLRVREFPQPARAAGERSRT